jgi:hypothetical protein
MFLDARNAKEIIVIDGRKPKFREFIGIEDDGDARDRVLFSHNNMMAEQPTITAEQLNTLVAYLKDSKNTVDDGCKLIGVKWEDIDNASMFDFDARIFQCSACLAWHDLTRLVDDDGALCDFCDARRTLDILELEQERY